MKSTPHKLIDFNIDDYQRLRQGAIETVSKRFYETYPELLDSFGARGVEATKEDIGFTLDFLRPAVEFGFIKPFNDYLSWLCEVLSTRGVSSQLVENMLDWLAEFFEAQSPNDLGNAISRTLKSSIKTLKSNKTTPSNIDQLMPQAWPETVELEQALICGNLKQAKRIIDHQIKSGKSLLDVELHLIQPALYQVGRDWQQNKVTVAQEHLATSTAIVLMAQEFGQVELGESNGKRVICACVEGNKHAVGLRIVADAFELNGWDVMFLGPDLPSKELIQQVSKSLPDMLCLSASMPEHLPVAKAAILEIHKALGNKAPAIMLGGLAVNAFSAISDEIGANLTASDAEKALTASLK